MVRAIKSGSKSFIKKERLSSKKLINELFSRGRVKKFKDFRMHFLKSPDESAEYHQVLFSVPVKLFKKAVHRNRIKRQFRECYRKNKTVLYQNQYQGLPYLLAYVYISSYLPVYEELQYQVKASIEYLKNIESSNS
jgi:ribonuclease P protein component